MEFYAREALLTKSAVGKFEEYRQNSKFCDVNLKSEHVVVKAHRFVLAAVSPYFEGMFNAGFEESNEQVVNLPSISPDVLPLLVKFMYTGHVTITSSTVQNLMLAAHMMCLDNLVIGCTQYFKTQLDTSNALTMLSVAEFLNCSELFEYIAAYIGQQWSIVALEKDFLGLSLALFTKLLSCNKFALDDELEVVRAVVRWLEHEPARAQHCAALVRLLRLGCVPARALDDVWRDVGDAALAENLRVTSETTAAVANKRQRLRGSFYVLGHLGSSMAIPVFKYDLYNEVWDTVAPMKTRRTLPGVAALGGRLYVVGGRSSEILASGEVYDPFTNEWTPIADMKHARIKFNLVALGGKLYAVGGSSYRRLSSIEVYDPATDEWAPAGDLPHDVQEFVAATHDGFIYVLDETLLLRYDVTKRDWHPCAKVDDGYPYLPLAAAVFEDHLYAVCQYYGTEERKILRYRFATDEWELVTERSVCIDTHVLGAANGLLFLADEGALETYSLDEDLWRQGPVAPHRCIFMGSAMM